MRTVIVLSALSETTVPRRTFGAPGPCSAGSGLRRGLLGGRLRLAGRRVGGGLGSTRRGLLGRAGLGLRFGGLVVLLVSHGYRISWTFRPRSRAIVRARARSRLAVPTPAGFPSSPVASWKRRPKSSRRAVR